MTLEEVEPKRALFTLYEGGIYLHQSLSYLVMSVDHEHQFARVRRTNVEWVTRQRELREVEPWKGELARVMWHMKRPEPVPDEALEPNQEAQPDFLIVPKRLEEQSRVETEIVYGDVRESAIVFGYLKLHPRTHRVIETIDVASPPLEHVRKGVWLDFPTTLVQLLPPALLAPATHAVCHVVTMVLPLYVHCDPSDVGIECVSPLRTRTRPGRIVMHEKTNGTGMMRRALNCMDKILLKAYEVFSVVSLICSII